MFWIIIHTLVCLKAKKYLVYLVLKDLITKYLITSSVRMDMSWRLAIAGSVENNLNECFELEFTRTFDKSPNGKSNRGVDFC